MDRQSRSKLVKWTKELLLLNEEAESYYLNIARQDGHEPDFFGTVKPFADKVKDICEKWMPLATEFVQEARPLHIHPIQLQQTEENLEVVAIKSFYGKSSLKIQMETFKSVQYTLEQILQAIEEASTTK